MPRGKFALANQGCDDTPSYIMQDTRDRETGAVGGIESDVFVGGWPATICLTSTRDPNACGSNTVRPAATSASARSEHGPPLAGEEHLGLTSRLS